MAPIISENFDIAKQLSKHFEVRHAPVSYMKTTIVDGKRLFQDKVSSGDEKATPVRFQNSCYTTDAELVGKMGRILHHLWKTSRAPSTVTVESVTNPSKPIGIRIIPSRELMLPR